LGGQISASGAEKQVQTAERIRLLEAELDRKRRERNDLSQKLELYLAAASAHDEEVKRRQAEKNAIIAAFQQSGADATLTVSQLEHETRTVHVDDEDTRRLYIAARDRLKDGHDMTKELHEELLRLQLQLREQIGRSAQMEKIRLNEITISAHQTELSKLKAQSRSLMDANALLRQLVSAD
jgi:hypothetical protein